MTCPRTAADLTPDWVWRWGDEVQMRHTDPVELTYHVDKGNIFPHWVMMTPGTFNNDFYTDIFRTKTPFSERRQWLLENVGKGGHLSACQFPDQKWYVYEWSATKWSDSKTGGCAVMFRDEQDALMFKMRWG